MQKWEYLVLSFSLYFGSNTMSGLKINGKDVEPIEKATGLFGKNTYPEWATSFTECLAYFGEQGWELADLVTEMSELGARDRRELILKRPKIE